MSKKIAILQSNYIPWKGYFDIMNMVDEFVLFDEAQYTKNDWRNRNIIKTKQGLQWLTIPVRQENLMQKIKETRINDSKWNKKHWLTIQTNYAKSKYFADYKPYIEELYLNCTTQYLSEINYIFFEATKNLLNINTKISTSSDFELKNGKTERLIDICYQCNASEYISGPAAKQYIDEDLFHQADIKLTWVDYSNYPEYTQLFPPFEHGVTILDLIFNEGANSSKFMKSF